MKIYITISLFTILLSSCLFDNQPPQIPVEALEESNFHPVIEKAKERSLYADNVDWFEANKKFVAVEQRYGQAEALEQLINTLGDKHGTFRSLPDHQIVAYYTGPREETDNRDPDFNNSVINDIEAQFSYEILEGDIGYLRVVGIGPGDVKEQANQIRKGIRELSNKGIEYWILDLRYNGGGNMDPMIAGVAPLLGDGFIGGSVNRHGEERTLEIKGGEFYNFGRLVCEMDAFPKDHSQDKVAVLLSQYTTSSGEMLAIAFKGRENTTFLGEMTSGYVTGTGYESINDSLVMLLSEDVFMDRNKKTYNKFVGVDAFIEFEHNMEVEGDNMVFVARQWFEK